jgi:hypothetical protein
MTHSCRSCVWYQIAHRPACLCRHATVLYVWRLATPAVTYPWFAACLLAGHDHGACIVWHDHGNCLALSIACVYTCLHDSVHSIDMMHVTCWLACMLQQQVLGMHDTPAGGTTNVWSVAAAAYGSPSWHQHMKSLHVFLGVYGGYGYCTVDYVCIRMYMLHGFLLSCRKPGQACVQHLVSRRAWVAWHGC